MELVLEVIEGIVGGQDALALLHKDPSYPAKAGIQYAAASRFHR
jgi:hypothetical protein